MLSLFQDAPEYQDRLARPFRPTKVTTAEIHAAIPKHLFQRSAIKSLSYVLRDVAAAYALYRFALLIDPSVLALSEHFNLGATLTSVLRWGGWSFYWCWQGIVWAGWWCMAHDAGHGALSDYRWLNHMIGYGLHTFLLVPYFSWRATHRAHHKAANSMERDENFVPRTRSHYGLRSEALAKIAEYHEVFEDAPIATLLRMLFMQALGWQIYLVRNELGNPKYPPGTNHFFPSSPLFKKHERNSIIASNVGLAAMCAVIASWTRASGASTVFKLYWIPYLLANHWIVMLTYLHHSDPSVPIYRKNQWSFLRGALATVDRPLLGWAGRFFLHNISHDHIAHHLFSTIPFYNQPKVTEIIKEILKDDYNYDSTNTFRALYRTFTECCFVEDEGEIVFYKNSDGRAARAFASDAFDYPIKRVDEGED